MGFSETVFGCDEINSSTSKVHIVLKMAFLRSFGYIECCYEEMPTHIFHCTVTWT